MSYRFCSLIYKNLRELAPGGKNHVICFLPPRFLLADHLLKLYLIPISTPFHALLHAHEKSNQYLPWKFHTTRHSILNHYEALKEILKCLVKISAKWIYKSEIFGKWHISKIEILIIYPSSTPTRFLLNLSLSNAHCC